MAIAIKENQNIKDDIKESQKPDKAATNNEKAAYIYENKLSKLELSTLQRQRKEWLDWVIANGREPLKSELDIDNTKLAKELTESLLDALDSYKEATQESKINASAKKFTISQSEAIAPYITSDRRGLFGLVLFGLGFAFCFVDSVIGWDRVKAYFNKDKSTDEKTRETK